MSSEEQKRTPNPEDDRKQGFEESSESTEETQDSPENLGSLGQPGEDPGTVEEPESILTPDALVEEEPGVVTEDELATLVEELELVRRERDEYLDALRRLKAELENLRKRQEKERARLAQLASEGLVRKLLPVLDNLERALEAGGDIREGVRATYEQLVVVLGQEGLTPVFSDGQNFDPEVHEAVMSQPSEEHEEGTILQTFERGYLLKGKPIRPAKVVVAKQV
ncbi:MAG: nucleotide exchange factor GrpE [Actinomycetota bacterium]|nr:nucleotide exchange factor GrpE [Actinomycetota bacterium]